MSEISSPAKRLVAVEGLSTVLFGALTAPFLTPGHRRVPEWAQLLGLAVLCAMIGLCLRTWRLVMADGLRLRDHGRLRDQARDDRRSRLLVALYPALLLVLLPIPATWVAFWFWFTLATAFAGAISLALLLRRAIAPSPDSGADRPGSRRRTASGARRSPLRRS